MKKLAKKNIQKTVEAFGSKKATCSCYCLNKYQNCHGRKGVKG